MVTQKQKKKPQKHLLFFSSPKRHPPNAAFLCYTRQDARRPVTGMTPRIIRFNPLQMRNSEESSTHQPASFSSLRKRGWYNPQGSGVSTSAIGIRNIGAVEIFFSCGFPLGRVVAKIVCVPFPGPDTLVQYAACRASYRY